MSGPADPAPATFDADLDVQVAAALVRVRTAEEARRRHDVANARAAVDGAESLLTGGDDLSDVDRATLERVLVSGVERLRALLERDDQDVGPVSLAVVADSVAIEPRWYGRMSVDVAPDLVATGRPGPIAEAVRQLLAAGRGLGAARPLVLRGRRDGGFVGLWLPAGDGSAVRRDLPVAFHVAAHLVREQGGDIRVEIGAGGQRSIGICLPSAGELPGHDG